MNDIMVIVPSLNPDNALIQVVDGLRSAGFNNIIVVDDGSDDKHQEPFKHAKESGCTVILHDINMGKGQALRSAFKYVTFNRSDIKAVITVDGDNQHEIPDIVNCINEYRNKPDNIILGCRDFSQDDVPARSRFGNNMTRFVFRCACGIKISDTQTGLRCIPAQYLHNMLEIDGNRYEYETNMLLYMKEHRIPFSEVKIHTVYIEENSSSHFNPIKDSVRIYAVIFKFLASSVWASVVDLLMFAVMCHLLAGHLDKSMYILASTILARVISSLCNYTINHKIVFKSEGSMRNTIVRYYILCVCQMVVSYALVFLAAYVLHIGGGLVVAAKAVIDTILFFISFRIQKAWVFKK